MLFLVWPLAVIELLPGEKIGGPVHLPSADHGQQHAISAILRRNCEQVAVEHDEVGELADFQGSDRVSACSA
jgi:hypothetical protein